jgi:hypothetical protein
VFLTDYVVIALLQIERARAAGQPEPKILVRRIELKSAEEKKRKRAEKTDDSKPRREYEFVNCNAVVDSIILHIKKTYGVREKCKGHIIRIFSFVVALLGCDFSSGELPIRVNGSQKPQPQPIHHKPCNLIYDTEP